MEVLVKAGSGGEGAGVRIRTFIIESGGELDLDVDCADGEIEEICDNECSALKAIRASQD